MNTFKFKDLMINVIPERFAGGGGHSLCSMDQASADHTPITPWTPVILVARHTPRFEVLGKVVETADREALELTERLATEVGRAAVGGAVHALCTQEQATCEANPWISPVASRAGLRFSDLVELKLHLREAVEAIETVEHKLERKTRRQARELVPKLKAAVEELGG